MLVTLICSVYCKCGNKNNIYCRIAEAFQANFTAVVGLRATSSSSLLDTVIVRFISV